MSTGSTPSLPHSPESGGHHVWLHVPFTPTYHWPAAFSALSPQPQLKKMGGTTVCFFAFFLWTAISNDIHSSLEWHQNWRDVPYLLQGQETWKVIELNFIHYFFKCDHVCLRRFFFNPIDFWVWVHHCPASWLQGSTRRPGRTWSGRGPTEPCLTVLYTHCLPLLCCFSVFGARAPTDNVYRFLSCFNMTSSGHRCSSLYLYFKMLKYSLNQPGNAVLALVIFHPKILTNE